MVRETFGHYRILEQVGSGGMGVVYRAHDEILHRDVALKLLRADTLAQDNRHTRLLSEARTAAALNHPHICTIYEVGEFEGTAYIAMELVEGTQLSALVFPAGLPLESVLRYGRDIADALVHAHERGIIHRDLKSANVMIRSDGRVKVLDFGLATQLKGNLTDQETQSLDSMAGAIVGTLPYMAPEILLGQPADARADVWSFGVVLYNMATGTLPFQGKTTYELTSAILNQPLKASAINNAGLRTIITRCLAKQAANRYPSATEIEADLDSLKARHNVPPSQPRQSRKRLDSIAVLPFENATGDPQNEYLSDGIAESVLNNLSRIGKLRVVPRTTAFRYKGSHLDLKAIAEELNVRAVLLGRVLHVADHLSIRAELVDVLGESQLWGEHYYQKSGDIFVVQEQIAKQISEKLRLHLSFDEAKHLTKRYTGNADAYRNYLHGRFYWNKRTPAALKQAIDYFQQAIAIDPKYALAHSGLADCYFLLGSFPWMDPKAAFPIGHAALLKASEVDDTLAEVHSALGHKLFAYDRKFSDAEREFRLSIRLNPRYATAHHWFSFCLAAMGRFEEAIAEVRTAEELDPLSLIISANVGTVLYFARLYERAIEQYRKALDIDPNFWVTHWMLGLAYEQKKRYADAIDAFEKALAICPESFPVLSASLARIYALSGRQSEAVGLLDELQRSPEHTVASSYYLAMAYAALGDGAAALERLRTSCADHELWVVFLKVDPKADSLRRIRGIPRVVAGNWPAAIAPGQLWRSG